MGSAQRWIVLLVITFVCSACTAVAPMDGGDPPTHPLRAYGPDPAWATTPTPPPETATPFASAFQATTDTVVDLTNGSQRTLRAVRDNDGRVWLSRGDTAVWERTSDGLVLRALDGHELERILGATDLRESRDGAARAYATPNGWVVETAYGSLQIAGDIRFPSFSPDGQYLAYERVGARTRDLFVLDTHSGVEFTAAHGIGRCHCSSAANYGFPRWASSVDWFTYQDGGLYEAPLEEHSGGAFAFDVATRQARRAPGVLSSDVACDGTGTLVSNDARFVLTFTRLCQLHLP